MALHNLARVTSATTGTGTLTLGSAVSGFLTFADAGVANGERVLYAIRDGANSEVGRGTYTTSGTTLSRDTVYESTNGGAAINCSGSQEVFITALGEILPPGLAASPDIAGVGGAGTSEEYDTATTGITFDNAVTTADSDTTAKSHLYIRITGDTTVHRGTKAWAPVGAFDVRSKISLGGTITNAQSFGLFINDNSSSDSNGALLWITITPATPTITITAYTYATGTPTQRGSSWTLRNNFVYVRVARDGSNNVSFYFSGDGLAWQLISTVSFTFTPSRLGYRTQLSNSSDALDAYVDFLRTSV
jgi:hypothetical protein